MRDWVAMERSTCSSRLSTLLTRMLGLICAMALRICGDDFCACGAWGVADGEVAVEAGVLGAGK
jgi:hypothetical protein